MFLDTFQQVVGGGLAIIVLCAIVAGLLFSFLFFYQLGETRRMNIERRAELFEAVQAQKRKEQQEIKAMDKRFKELDRSLFP